jgi:hypothetical protein
MPEYNNGQKFTIEIIDKKIKVNKVVYKKVMLNFNVAFFILPLYFTNRALSPTRWLYQSQVVAFLNS